MIITPWGFYKIIADSSNYKIKEITIYPNQRLSYQRHFKRLEHWLIISGKAKIIIEDNLYI